MVRILSTYISLTTSLVVQWSGSLPTNNEVPSSIPGSTMGIFPCRERFPVVTMVWVVSRFRLKAPPCISSSCLSPLTSSGQRRRASRASQPQKSATLSPQPGGKPGKFIRTCGGIWERRKKKNTETYVSGARHVCYHYRPGTWYTVLHVTNIPVEHSSAAAVAFGCSNT